MLDIALGLARELRAGSVPATQADLDSSLERDLGFDSLARAELLLRLEAAFDVRLPPRTLVTAETPRDLLRAVESGSAGAPARVPETAAAPAVVPPAAIPERATSLVDVLSWHATMHADRTHLTLLAETDAGPTAEPLTYGQLHDAAVRVATALVAGGLEVGQSVAIMLPTSRDFFLAFFGTLLAGGVPVPIYPPARRSQLEEHLARQSTILGNCLAAMLITVPEAALVARVLQASTPTLKRIVSIAELLAADATPRALPEPAPGDTAFLQYTSGSTGNPKGVILTHANLLANIHAIGRGAAVAPGDVFVSWLPLYHDMGLIGAWLATLYYAVPLVVMPPTDFLARPERWLWAIHRYRATLSAGPNFAYELCATRLPDDRLAGLDLSSWRIAFNGAEPVNPGTLARFAARFAPHGFDPRAQTPVYGLAESAVGLAFPPLLRGPLIDRIDRTRLAQDAVAVPAGATDANPLEVVSCGVPLPVHELRAVDASGRELPERHEGRIQFRGPSATSGYFRNPEATRELFVGDWLDTGDLGYVAGGEIYVTGRAKDIIIRGGQHIHPQEAETAVGGIAGIRKGCVVVFGVADRATGTERVVVLAETHATDTAAKAALGRAIAERAGRLLGAPPDDIVLAPPHTVLKTSSGKIRRAACRALYESGMPLAGPSALLPQTARLAAKTFAGWLRQVRGRAATVAWVAWVGVLLLVAGLAASLLVTTLPSLRSRRQAAAVLARLFLAAAGIPVRVTGADRFPARGPITVVVNHASYVDAIVMTAVLPARCAFVAKRGLARFGPMRFLLGRIGTRFVERFEPEASVAAAKELAALAHGGESLAFFAEGTFTREPGLRAFHMGAFVAAANAGTPLVPVALRGTRSVLRADQWLPHRGLIQVVVDAPLMPDGADWAAAVRLRDRARSAILAGCGEPDLVPRSGNG